MGWDFRGLYTVGTATARDRLTRDELVRGRFAQIPPPAAPEALLPPEGLLVVHGFGPYRGEHVPWDAFWPAAGTRIADAPAEVRALDRMRRPPRNLVAWMREFAGATGVPMVLYECVMSAGYVEEEIAVVCTGTDTRLCQLRTARTSPLIVMLEVLGARPRQWVFGPHHKALPNWLDVPAEDVARLSPSEAYRRDDLEVVDALLRRGAELVDESLCQAAEHGNPAIVERLLRARAPLAGYPYDALGHAANPACARLLLAAGATIGERTLDSVTWRGFGDTARLLIDLGAPVDLVALWEPAVRGNVQFLVERALADGAAVDRPRGLLLAAYDGREEIVDLLLDAGTPIDPNAVGGAAGHGHTSVLRKLLARGADPRGGDPDHPPIWRAAHGGHYDAVVLLLEAGADPGARGSSGVPLHGACYSGRLDLVQLLLRRRPDLVDARVGIFTPLREAVAGGNPDVIAYLLEHGADPDGTDQFGDSVRDYATRRGITLPARAPATG